MGSLFYTSEYQKSKTKDQKINTINKAAEYNLRHSINKLQQNYPDYNLTLHVLLKNVIFSRRKYKYIEGPCSLSLVQSNKHRKTIYIFGEKHCTENEDKTFLCQKKSHTESSDIIHISQFFSDISTTCPVFLDIFGEWSKREKERFTQYYTPINLFGVISRSTGGACLYDQRAENYTPGCITNRWHYIDVRNDEDSSWLSCYAYYNTVFLTPETRREIYEFVEIYLPLLKYVSYNTVPIALRDAFMSTENLCLISRNIPDTLYIEYLNKLNIPQYLYEEEKLLGAFTILITDSSPEIVSLAYGLKFRDTQKISNIVLDYPQILKKELARSTQRDAITKYGKELLDELIEINEYKYEEPGMLWWSTTKTLKGKASISRRATEFLQKIGKNIPTRNSFINPLSIFLTELYTTWMDIYTLARMFKKFDVKDKHQPAEPHNILYYAGNYHAKSIRKFLNTFDDFKEIAQETNFACKQLHDNNKTNPYIITQEDIDANKITYQNFEFKLPSNAEVGMPVSLNMDTTQEYHCCLDMASFPQPFFTAEYSSY